MENIVYILTTFRIQRSNSLAKITLTTMLQQFIVIVVFTSTLQSTFPDISDTTAVNSAHNPLILIQCPAEHAHSNPKHQAYQAFDGTVVLPSKPTPFKVGG